MALDSTSRLSPYFSSGTLRARTAVSMAVERNRGKLTESRDGRMGSISEVAWRDLQAHPRPLVIYLVCVSSLSQV